MRHLRTVVQVALLSLTASASRATEIKRPALPQPAPVTASTQVAPRHVAKLSSFAQLSPVTITNFNARKAVSTRLYTDSGHVDELAARRLDALLCDARDLDDAQSHSMDRRLLQLLFRTAYHFSSHRIEVVSAYRKAVHKQPGVHAQGRAIDFRLANVTPAALAAYLRTIPRVGVGIYTHPKTQFVHLDVREQSFHWLDASPPRRHWREKNISSKALPALDASYRHADDWPEGFSPPQ
jgi:uncharacterized protein YcbK (DUF882 family)